MNLLKLRGGGGSLNMHGECIFFVGCVSHYNIPEEVQTVKAEICGVVIQLRIGGSCQFSGLQFVKKFWMN